MVYLMISLQEYSLYLPVVTLEYEMEESVLTLMQFL